MTSPPSAQGSRPAVEIGCVIAGDLHPVDFGAVRVALQRVIQMLAEHLPDFAWNVRLVHRREVVLDTPADPMRLLDLGLQERDVGRWDFTFVIAEAELRSLGRRSMLGAPSQVADVALLSTSRLDPAFVLEEANDGERRVVMQRRVAALVMHLLGHLNDLPHSEDPGDFMFDLAREMDLDRMAALSDDSWGRMRERISEVADPRVEERRSRWWIPFTLAVVWTSRRDLLRGIRRIAPWEFPLHYGRLTTASVSMQVILMVTAEAWELGMSQHWRSVLALSLAALLGASYYLVKRQNLVEDLTAQQSEQAVTTRVTVIASVLIGMATTYSLLFGSTWVIAKALFSPALIHSWTPSIAHVTEAHYLLLGGFIAAVGILIGALGASFERESYFRRVTMLDEET